MERLFVVPTGGIRCGDFLPALSHFIREDGGGIVAARLDDSICMYL